MPAVRMFGRKWRMSSDFLPFFAGAGLVIHVCWVIFIIVWPIGILKLRKCNDTKAGRHFLSAVWLCFVLNVLSCIQELLITLIGLRGTPLETTKRKFIHPVLYTQMFNWVAQIGAVSHGTYVVLDLDFYVNNDCNNASLTILKVLIWSSWAMLALNWGRVLLIYSLFPDFERVDSWATRLHVLTWCFGSTHVISRLQEHQQRPLGQLAKLYSRLLHGADLSPSDGFISLILLSAAQRKSRQMHVRNAIKLYKAQTAAAKQQADKAGHGNEDGSAAPPAPSQSSSRHPLQSGQHKALLLSERQNASLGAQTTQAIEQTGSGTAVSQGGQQDIDSHAMDMPAEHHEPLPPQCLGWSVHGEARVQGKVNPHSQPASNKKADMQDMRNMEQGHTGIQDVFCKSDFVLAPSSSACEYHADLEPDKLADIYTGYKERVAGPVMTEAATFVKYAVAAYGAAGYQSLHQESNVAATHSLLHNRGKDRYRANKLMASKITSLEQHLDYEAIIQTAEIADEDVLYINFENQTLGSLPYMLALDRPTKSIVMAIRGTSSIADLATDMLAEPESLQEWLPDTMTEAEGLVSKGGSIASGAHSGMLAAATNIWKDLQAHGILPALLRHSSHGSSLHEFCTSVVVNKDCIPRLSLKTMHRFVEGMVTALSCSKLNAFQIFWGSYGQVNRRSFFDRDLFWPSSDMPDEAREMLDRFQEFTLTDQDMVPPGRVMYLRCFKAPPKPPVSKLERRLDVSASNGAASEGERHQCGGQQDWHSGEEDMDTGCTTLHSMHRRRMEKRALHACLHNPKELFWDAVWIRPGDVITEGVLVSPRMVQDHLPASLLRSLKAVTQRLAQEEGKSGKEYRQVSTVDKQSSGEGSMEEESEIV